MKFYLESLIIAAILTTAAALLLTVSLNLIK